MDWACHLCLSVCYCNRLVQWQVNELSPTEVIFLKDLSLKVYLFPVSRIIRKNSVIPNLMAYT